MGVSNRDSLHTQAPQAVSPSPPTCSAQEGRMARMLVGVTAEAPSQSQTPHRELTLLSEPSALALDAQGRVCMEFTQTFLTSELGSMRQLQQKEEQHSALRDQSLLSNCPKIWNCYLIR